MKHANTMGHHRMQHMHAHQSRVISEKSVRAKHAKEAHKVGESKKRLAKEKTTLHEHHRAHQKKQTPSGKVHHSHKSSGILAKEEPILKTDAPEDQKMPDAPANPEADSLAENPAADSGADTGSPGASEDMPKKDFDAESIDDNPFAEELKGITLDITDSPAEAGNAPKQVKKDDVVSVEPPKPATEELPVTHVLPEVEPEAELTEKPPEIAEEEIPETPRAAGHKGLGKNINKGLDADILKEVIKSFNEKIKQFDENMRALHDAYMDGALTKDIYESTKEHILSKIKQLKIDLSIEKQTRMVRNLKNAIDIELKENLENPDFKAETESIRNDLENLGKLHELKVIDDAAYEEARTKIQERMERSHKTIEQVNDALDNYLMTYVSSVRESGLSSEERDGGGQSEMQSGDEQASKEGDISKNPSSSADEAGLAAKTKKPFFERLKSMLFLGGRKNNNNLVFEDDQELKTELDRIATLESKRDAEIEMRALLKGEIQKHLGVETQLSYSQLMSKIPELKADATLKNELLEFFKEASEREYKGVGSVDEYVVSYNKSKKYLGLIKEIPLPVKAAAEKPKRKKK